MAKFIHRDLINESFSFSGVTFFAHAAVYIFLPRRSSDRRVRVTL